MDGIWSVVDRSLLPGLAWSHGGALDHERLRFSGAGLSGQSVCVGSFLASLAGPDKSLARLSAVRERLV